MKRVFDMVKIDDEIIRFAWFFELILYCNTTELKHTTNILISLDHCQHKESGSVRFDMIWNVTRCKNILNSVYARKYK